MASVQFSGIGITQIRGSIGGTTIQLNANGAFSRNKPIPTQPDTAFQIAQQAIFEEVTGHWRTLSQAQMDAWIAFAATTAGEYQNRLGETKNYTGQQLFIKLNLSAYSTSFPIEDPPAQPSFTVNPIDDFIMEVDEGVITDAQITFDNSLSDASITVKLYATMGMSPGINRPRRSLFKLISEFNGNTGSVVVNFDTEYFTRFGIPTAGKKVFILTIFTDIASGYELINAQAVAVVVEL